MLVQLVNGSPHEHGCTDAALSIVADALCENGVDAEIYWLGAKPITGCRSCRACANLGGRCVQDDEVNEFKELARATDGFVFGSPVHYGSCSATLKDFMDRLFFSERHGNKSAAFQLKPAASQHCFILNNLFTLSPLDSVVATGIRVYPTGKPSQAFPEILGGIL